MLRFWFLLLVVVIFIDRGYCLEGKHICYNQESFTELEELKTTTPVRIRSNQWCFNLPPRCSSYHIEMKDVIKMQNITKTRQIGYCCYGYTEIKSENGTGICIPKCPGGCIHGLCTAPNICSCDLGFEGQYCSQKCKNRTYGPNCTKLCKCKNGSYCEHKTGMCRCTAGWIGNLCDMPCPIGYYGINCRFRCQPCTKSGQRCNPQTGECVNVKLEVTRLLAVTTTTTEIDSVPTSPVKGRNGGETTNRIKAKHWIQVNANGNIQIKNCTNQDDDNDNNNCQIKPNIKLNFTSQKQIATKQQQYVELVNEQHPQLSVTDDDSDKLANLINQTHQQHVQITKNNSIMIDALNSSIVNLTTDVSRLSEQVSAAHAVSVGDGISSENMIVPKVTIILDTPLSSVSPSIINDVSDTGIVDEQTEINKSKNNNENLITLPNHFLLPDKQNILENGINMEEIKSLTDDANESNKTVMVIDDKKTSPPSEITNLGNILPNEINDNNNDQLLNDNTTDNEDNNNILHIYTLESADDQLVAQSTGKLTTPPMVPIVLIILIVIIACALISFGIIYLTKRNNDMMMGNKNHSDLDVGNINTNHQNNSKLTDANITFQKPLPEIPSFTHSITRKPVQTDFYDRPLNNRSIPGGLNRFGYSYAITTDTIQDTDSAIITLNPPNSTTVTFKGGYASEVDTFNGVGGSFRRKASNVDHIYDEIGYIDAVGKNLESTKR